MLQPVQVSQSPVNKFREYLSSQPRSQRFTVPQKKMVEFIFSAHNHFDAEQLMGDMDRAALHISRATVYRTLKKLVEAGLLRSLQFGDRVVYEHDYGYPQHEHIYCRSCGKVIEFQRPELDAVCQEICRQHRFQFDSHSLIVRGTCEACNRSRITKRRLDLV